MKHKPGNRVVVVGATVLFFVVGLGAYAGLAAAQAADGSVDVQQSCLGGRGRVDITVSVADDGSAHKVSTTVGRVGPRTATVDSGESIRFTVTGRPNGPLVVATSVDGTQVDEQSFTVACTPVRTEPVLETSCLAARGRVDVYVPSGEDYVVSFPGLPNRTITAGMAAQATWTGRPDGTYTVTATSGDTSYSLEATVECGGQDSAGGGLTGDAACSALADDLRRRALDQLAPLDFDMVAYYDLETEPFNWWDSPPHAMADDAFENALPEDRPNEADVAAFGPDDTFWASRSKPSDKSRPVNHPDSVAVLAIDNGVIIIDQRANDLVVTRYNASGDTATATLRIEGAYLRARYVDGVVQLVTQSPPAIESNDGATIESTTDDDWLPTYTWTAPDGSTESQFLADCDATRIPEEFAGFSVVSLTSLDAETLEPTLGAGVVADAATVLVDDTQAAVATQPWDPTHSGVSLDSGLPLDDSSMTSIHTFDLSDPKRASYQTSVPVRGALDELTRLDDGRLAAWLCEGSPWRDGIDEEACFVSTVDTSGYRVKIEESETVAKRGDVREFRFGGELGFVKVRSYSPSLLIDLSEPGVFGQSELESGYKFFLGKDRMLHLGRTRVALYDISDPGAMVELAAKEILLDFASLAENSFSWDPDRGLFAVATTERHFYNPHDPDTYLTGDVAVFTVSDFAVDFLTSIGYENAVPSGTPVLPSQWDFEWRTLIDGDTVRIATETHEIRLSLPERTSEGSCTVLADDLRRRALEKLAPLSLDTEWPYYDLTSTRPQWARPPRTAMAVDAFDLALPQARANEADVAAFAPVRTYFAGLGGVSNPSAHPDSVAVLAVDGGVIVIDQRPKDLLMTRYDATGTTAMATLRIEGVYVRARLVDGVVQLVTQAVPNLAGTDAASIEATETAHWLPLYAWTAPDGTTDSQVLTDCDATSIPDDFAGFSVVALTGVDPETLEPTPGAGVVADEAMVLVDDAHAVIATDPWDPTHSSVAIPHGLPIDEARVTTIHDFDLSDPASASYRASGRVRGDISALGRLDDGRLVAGSCEGSSWWLNSADAQCWLSVLETVRDTVRVTEVSDSLGRRAEVVRVRLSGDLAVVRKRGAASLVVDLATPGAFERGTLPVTSSRWSAFALSDDRLLLIDGSQLVLFDVSDVSNPVRLDTYGEPDSVSSELYWLTTYFEDSFAWDPSRGVFSIAYLRTSFNDPYHSGGYTTSGAIVFTISDDTIDFTDWIGGSRTFDSELNWRTFIDGDILRVVIPGWEHLEKSLSESN